MLHYPGQCASQLASGAYLHASVTTLDRPLEPCHLYYPSYRAVRYGEEDGRPKSRRCGGTILEVTQVVLCDLSSDKSPEIW
jgi:hypothetical protein